MTVAVVARWAIEGLISGLIGSGKGYVNFTGDQLGTWSRQGGHKWWCISIN